MKTYEIWKGLEKPKKMSLMAVSQHKLFQNGTQMGFSVFESQTSTNKPFLNCFELERWNFYTKNGISMAF
jgi:hypothetical protein